MQAIEVSFDLIKTAENHKGFRPVLRHVREKIRTPDTLVRSQVLYPAELLPHIIQRKIILQLFGNCKSFSDLFQNLSFSTRLARIPYSGHFGKPFFHILQFFQKGQSPTGLCPLIPLSNGLILSFSYKHTRPCRQLPQQPAPPAIQGLSFR